MFCDNCGAENRDTANFCWKCQTDLRAVRSVSSGASVEAEQDSVDISDSIVERSVGDVLVDRFELKEHIGSGAMGVVWLAHDRELNVDRALKLLPALLNKNPKHRELLKDEVRNAQELGHPNIMRIYDFHADWLTPFISMEFVDGSSLDDVERFGKVLPLDDLLEYLESICSAFQYAHDIGVVHRDIKPANIMVTRSGVVKIADFGLSARVKASMTSISRSAVSGGTMAYMSPEQIRNRDVGPWSDQYSLAVTVYELLSGRLPFEGNYESLRYQIFEEEPEPIDGVPDHVNDALLRAMAKDRHDRFEDVMEFYEACVDDGEAESELIDLPPWPNIEEELPMSPLPPGILSEGQSILEDLGIEMIPIPAGSFRMGNLSGNGFFMEEPVHSVRLDGFEMSATEVTQAQYEAVMGNNPSHFKGANLPVECVSWNDAVEFCRKLSEQADQAFRLPTEAEWEYACRAGTETEYYTGDSESDMARAGWYDGNSGERTHPVGQKAPNAWGLYDMHGNVLEWCGDWGDWDYYGSSPSSNPTGPSSGSYRVLRGGCWENNAGRCRSAYRSRNWPTYTHYIIGFRLSSIY